jgi:hypothetical protein
LVVGAWKQASEEEGEEVIIEKDGKIRCYYR